MKKHPYLSVALLCVFAILFNGCSGDNSKNSLQSINEFRIVEVDGAEVGLYPFIIFNKVRFDSLDYGIWTYACFTVLDQMQKQLVPNLDNRESSGDSLMAITPYSSFYVKIDDDKATHKSFTIKLKLLEGQLTRKVKAGETYNLLYYYEVDGAVHRDNVATEYNSGYEIVDIVPEGQKFRNQELEY